MLPFVCQRCSQKPKQALVQVSRWEGRGRSACSCSKTIFGLKVSLPFKRERENCSGSLLRCHEGHVNRHMWNSEWNSSFKCCAYAAWCEAISFFCTKNNTCPIKPTRKRKEILRAPSFSCIIEGSAIPEIPECVWCVLFECVECALSTYTSLWVRQCWSRHRPQRWRRCTCSFRPGDVWFPAVPDLRCSQWRRRVDCAEWFDAASGRE